MMPRLLLVALLLMFAAALAAKDGPCAHVRGLPEALRHQLLADPEAGLSAVAKALQEDCKDQTTLLRRIHDWILVNLEYDHETAASGRVPPSDWREALKSGKAVCGGYASLCVALAQKCGLQAVAVSGYARCDGLDAFREIDPHESNHAWNAVQVDGRWRLLDITWNDSIKDVYRKVWLDVDPALFVTSHFPEQDRWQLLDTPIDAAAFLASVPMTPRPFVQEHRSAWPPVVEQSGPGAIRLRLPDPGKGHYYLSKLRTRDGGESFGNRHILAGKPKDKFRYLHVSMPAAGTYLLTVFRAPIPVPGRASGALKDAALFSLPVSATAPGPKAWVKRYVSYWQADGLLQGPLQEELAGDDALVLHVRSKRSLFVVDGRNKERLTRMGDGWQAIRYPLKNRRGSLHIAYLNERRGMTPILTYQLVRSRP